MNSKNSFIILLFAFLPLSGFSQYNIGLNSSLTFLKSNKTYNIPKVFKLGGHNKTTAYNLNLYHELRLTKLPWFFLGGETGYSLKGFQTYDVRTNMHYMSFNLLPGFIYQDKYTIMGGIGASYLFGASDSYIMESFKNTTGYKYKRWEKSFIMAIGYNYKDFKFNAGYIKGLDYYTEAFIIPNHIEIRFDTYYLSVGYMFNRRTSRK
jgi:hypothetical protein